MNDQNQDLSATEPSFELCQDSLYACCHTVQQPLRTSVLQIKRALSAGPHHAFFLFEDALDELAVAIIAGTEGRFKIGERRNAEVTTTITKDKMEALVQTSPVFGGNAITRAQIEESLQGAGIIESCWIEEAIETVLSSPQVNDLRIARGKEPERGSDASLTFLVQTQVNLQGQVDDHNRVDHHQRYDYPTVEAGTPLMRRTPPGPGTEGYNVLGEVVMPSPGANLEFASTEGSEISAEDENLLLSSIKGHPVVISHGVRVDQTLVLDKIDLESGNVDFDGSLTISGDVTDGFIVKATGDIHIGGSVLNAVIDAGGELMINGGALGHEPNKKTGESYLLKLHAGTLLHANFISYAELRVGSTLHVRKYIAHCDTHASGEIQLGQDGGDGIILGGECYSESGITAKVLGSKACIKTQLVVGIDDELFSERDELRKKHELALNEAQQLEKILETIRKSGKSESVGSLTLNKAQKIANTIVHINSTASQLENDITEIELRMEAKSPSYVDIKQKIFPGVTVKIDGISRSFNEESGKTKLVRTGHKLTASK